MPDKKPELNVTSYNQQGGITAGTVNIGSQPRHLAHSDIDNLRRIPMGSDITVVSPIGDNEAAGFALEIEGWLLANGYPSTHARMVMHVIPFYGQGINRAGDKYEVIVGSQR